MDTRVLQTEIKTAIKQKKLKPNLLERFLTKFSSHFTFYDFAHTCSMLELEMEEMYYKNEVGTYVM